jgi:glycerol-3-phosphate dehydrogenase
MFYNYIIIGAGINGAGIANELANYDKNILVIDKSTIGSGTSSKSSGLIHGGLRYLENYEFKLVRESLKERNYLIKKYPKLVEPTQFFLPIFSFHKRNKWLIKLGLIIYDYLDLKNIYKSKSINLNEIKAKFPLLKKDKLTGGFLYWDAKTNDKLLTQKVAEEAKKNGVKFIENCKINFIKKEFEFNLQTNLGEFRTKNLIVSTGPWISEFCDSYKLDYNYTIKKVSGIHIEINKVLSRLPLILQTENNRIFFVIPTDSTTIIGTTERNEIDSIDNVKINKDDVKYLIDLSNFYFNSSIQEKDIIHKWIGVRPLIESSRNLSKISRDYQLDVIRYNNGLYQLNVFGGKLTTFRALSKKVVKKITQPKS